MNFRYWCSNCGHEESTGSSARPLHCGRVMKAQGREDKRKALLHPMQPIEDDGNDVVRFKGNAIVRHLLDHGGINLNNLAVLPFPREEWVQFAQLIGYSVSGFSELSYVHDEDPEGLRRLQHAARHRPGQDLGQAPALVGGAVKKRQFEWHLSIWCGGKPDPVLEMLLKKAATHGKKDLYCPYAFCDRSFSFDRRAFAVSAAKRVKRLRRGFKVVVYGRVWP